MSDVRSDLRAARARRRRRAMAAGTVVVAVCLALAFGALVASGALETDPETPPAALERPTTTSTSRVPRNTGPECGALLTRDDPLVLWVGGDSLAGSLGPALGEQAGATGVVQTIYDSHVSSGLSTPEFVDWPEHATDPESELVALDPDVVVFIIGANDWPAVTSPASTWEPQYEQQVEEMLTLLEGTRDDRHVYWVGSPILQEKRKDIGIQQINAVAKRVVDRHPRATYVDAYTLFADTEGKYAASLPDDTGKTVRMRAADGVHLTDAGGEHIGTAVFELVDQQCDVTAHAVSGASIPVIQGNDSDGPGGGSGETGPSTRSGSSGTSATTAPTVETLPGPAPPPEPEPPAPEPGPEPEPNPPDQTPTDPPGGETSPLSIGGPPGRQS